MATSNLLNHCGARIVTPVELDTVKPPPPTQTWYPLAHAHVLGRVKTTLQDSGFTVEREKLALSRGDARFFGTLDLSTVVTPGITLAVGIRNSTDKSFPIGFCAGARVFVCDNLAFNSEVVVSRKHTRFGDQRFSEALSHAVQSLHQFREAEAARITRFRETDISDLHGDGLLLRLWERDILSHRLVPCALRQWREPEFPEFRPRNLWSLYNAATFALADRQKSNPTQFAHLTIALGGVLEQAAVSPAAQIPSNGAA
jgi:hypothetical protein